MKKILSLLFVFLCLTLLAGCAKEEDYPAVESTEEEARVVITLKIEDTEYQVKYELYRALFLNNKANVDRGDDTVWSSADAQTYIDKINEIIVKEASEIFAAIHIAESIGYDVYSKDAENRIKSFIAGAVTGDANQAGHGSYDKYLENLKNNNLNYSTAILLYRYALAIEAIENYYYGEYEYSEDDVKEYYYSDSCARILQAYFPAGAKSYSDVVKFKENLSSLSDEYAIAVRIIGGTAATESDLIVNNEVSGILLGRTALSSLDYYDYISTVFSTADGSFSEIITLTNTNADGYYFVYKLEKTDQFLEDFYTLAEYSYLENIIGGVLGSAENELIESPEFTSDYSYVSHKDISMN